LTHYGGAYFFHEFLQVLQVRDFLARHLTYPRRNHRYSLSQMIMALVYPIVLGLDRLETASFLRFNGTFQYLTGLPSFPDPQTLRRFLHQAPDSFLEQMHRVNDRLLQSFIHRPDHRSRLIFDLDSTVVTVFGRQQKAEVGYNPVIGASVPTIRYCVWKPTPPICGIPNCGQGTPAHGMAALNCWRLVSSTYHQIFESCVCGRMPVLVSIQSCKSSKPELRSMLSLPA
jgi:hypothetical protein